MHPLRTLRALRFLFLAPFILLLLLVINIATYHGEWWIGWAALGIGIAWIVCLFRVLGTLALVGGAAALATYLASWRRRAP
jgi:hypothetical protein